jgi:hypothetical protein
MPFKIRRLYRCHCSMLYDSGGPDRCLLRISQQRSESKPVDIAAAEHVRVATRAMRWCNPPVDLLQSGSDGWQTGARAPLWARPRGAFRQPSSQLCRPEPLLSTIGTASRSDGIERIDILPSQAGSFTVPNRASEPEESWTPKWRRLI